MHKDNFRYLLAALILYLIVVPALKGWLLIPRAYLTPISFIFLVGIGVWSLRNTTWVFTLAMSLAIPPLHSTWLLSRRRFRCSSTCDTRDIPVLAARNLEFISAGRVCHGNE